MTGEMILLLESLGTKCIDAYQIARTHPVRRLDSWELKPYAILNSSFAEVLYLDADNLPVQNPEFLFDLWDYKTAGALFWPDRYQGPGTGHEWMKREAWNICEVPYRVEPEIEAGQLLIDKQRCWKALLLTMHWNEHSDYYYAWFYGDKDTFRMAWHRTQTRFALVPFPPDTLGDSEAMVQFDLSRQPLFQHRNGQKWSLKKPVRPIARFLFEQQCQHFLEELRLQWQPPARSFPSDFGALEEAAYLQICSQQFWAYKMEGRGGRVLQLLPSLQIGAGAALMEQSWMVEEDVNGDIALTIRNANAPTCFLRFGEDKCWSGRWLVYERMQVWLQAYSPGIQ